MHLTVAYITARREPCLDWFLGSLRAQERVTGPVDRVIIVDARRREALWTSGYLSVPPKPTVWQGPHRRTRCDYFAAANARNTALCLAPDGWIAFVDDISVLMPGWLACVHEAMRKGYVVGGAYKKVRRLVVEDGSVVSCEECPEGLDTRWNIGRDDGPVPIGGGQLYGCSLAAPTESLIRVGGFDERCDCVGLGSEDYVLGLQLEQAGCRLMYDRRMLTLESEERHHWEPPMKRVIEKLDGQPDASHVLLNRVKSGEWGQAENAHLGKGGLRMLRLSVLGGEPFPVPTGPTHNWYSGVPLCDL